MLQLSQKELNIVKEIVRRHIPKRIVWAFGSRVKGTSRKTSDLDLAVISKKPLSLSQHAKLTNDFDISSLPFKVDIVDWATTSPTFRKIIADNKIVIQSKSASP